MHSEFDTQVSAFVSGGNRVEGRPTLRGTFELKWAGKGSHIKFSEGVRLVNVVIEINGSNASLEIGPDATVNGLIQLGSDSEVAIGEKTIFNRRCQLSAWEGATIKIGRNCLFSNVAIRTSDMHTIYDLKTGDRLNPAACVEIGENVWAGERVLIYKGVTVGAGSMLGAASVVTKSIPSNCVATGVPARVVRSNIGWRRELSPATVRPALPAPRVKTGNASPLTKEALADLNQRRQYKQICHLVESQLPNCFASISALPPFAKWYYARAASALDRDRDLVCSLLSDVIRAVPHHKPARDLLRSLRNRVRR